MWVNGEFSLLWSSKKKYLPFKRNNKVPKNLWLTGIFTSSLMKFKLFYIFPLLFPAPKARGKRALFTCLFSSPYLGTSGNIAGFKVIGPCLRCWQHKAKLWAPGMQAVRLGCCHGNAAGCRSSPAPGSAHPFWAIPKPPKKHLKCCPAPSQLTAGITVDPGQWTGTAAMHTSLGHGPCCTEMWPSSVGESWTESLFFPGLVNDLLPLCPRPGSKVHELQETLSFWRKEISFCHYRWEKTWSLNEKLRY